MLSSCSHPVLIEFINKIAQSSRGALLLDYDGTLAPFRLDRYQAVPYPGLTPLLKNIMETGHTRIVVVTGRRAHEVLPLLGLSPMPEVWGTHGFERLYRDGTYERPDLDRFILNSLFEADSWVDRLGLHHLVEHKPGSLALHWRGHSEDEAQEICNDVLLGWMPIADATGLTVRPFDGGIEILGAKRNKADAVRAILAEMESDTPVAYLGDDQTDEDAFRALQGRGVSILVRPHWRETAADIWLRTPIELSAFFHDWLDACQPASPNQADEDPVSLKKAG